MSAESHVTRPDRISTAHGDLVFGRGCLVMGILNVTPDSFSDGGRYPQVEMATQRALAIQTEGAAILDIGGESTRPGSENVEPEEQIRRVVPVIRSARAEGLTIPISIDTRSVRVAEAALKAGADIVNDISAAQDDRNMSRFLAESSAPVILMHMQGTPATMQTNPKYDDVIREVGEFFEWRAQILEDAGVARQRMIMDPGIGFGKTLDHNLELLRAVGPIYGKNWRVLIGASRKAFLRKLLNLPSVSNLEDIEPDLMLGTAATVAHAVMTNVDIVRVHDVKQMRQIVEICNRLMTSTLE